MAIPHVLKWTDGAPDRLQPGMLIQTKSGDVFLVGDIDEDAHSAKPYSTDFLANTMRWAWAIAPHELEWVQRMAT